MYGAYALNMHTQWIILVAMIEGRGRGAVIPYTRARHPTAMDGGVLDGLGKPVSLTLT
jgi:hypothetical protein